SLVVALPAPVRPTPHAPHPRARGPARAGPSARAPPGASALPGSWARPVPPDRTGGQYFAPARHVRAPAPATYDGLLSRPAGPAVGRPRLRPAGREWRGSPRAPAGP